MRAYSADASEAACRATSGPKPREVGTVPGSAASSHLAAAATSVRAARPRRLWSGWVHTSPRPNSSTHTPAVLPSSAETNPVSLPSGPRQARSQTLRLNTRTVAARVPLGAEVESFLVAAAPPAQAAASPPAAPVGAGRGAPGAVLRVVPPVASHGGGGDRCSRATMRSVGWAEGSARNFRRNRSGSPAGDDGAKQTPTSKPDRETSLAPSGGHDGRVDGSVGDGHNSRRFWLALNTATADQSDATSVPGSEREHPVSCTDLPAVQSVGTCHSESHADGWWAEASELGVRAQTTALTVAVAEPCCGQRPPRGNICLCAASNPVAGLGRTLLHSILCALSALCII